MSLQITDPSFVPLGTLTLVGQRGVPSTHVAIAIKNIGVATVSGARVSMYAEKTPGVGDYDTSGHPSVDERQGRFQVTGVDSSGTAGQTVAIMGAQPLGYLAQGVLPPILPGDTILADVWIEQPSTSAGGGAVNIKLEVALDGSNRAVGPGVTDVGRGIIPGTNGPESVLLNGRDLTATGTPDGNVHVAAGAWMYLGVDGIDAGSETVALSQSDDAAATLGVGEAYIAAISQADVATPVTTKGLKALTSGVGPVAPPVPLGNALLGFVEVFYGVSGSVIHTADISQTDLSYGRYYGTFPATGLTATIHTGRALIANFMTMRDIKADVTLVNTATNYIWLEYTGAVTVTQTNVQPSPGAILLWQAVTSGGNITGNTDSRIFVGSAGVLSLHASTHATGGTDPVSPASIGAATTAAVALKADLASPTFTGTVAIPTATAADNSTKAASTAFVHGELASAFGDHTGTWTSDGTTTTFTLSPVPSSTSIPMVISGNQILIEGVDYTRTGTSSEVIDWTGHVPTATVIVYFRWRG